MTHNISINESDWLNESYWSYESYEFDKPVQSCKRHRGRAVWSDYLHKQGHARKVFIWIISSVEVPIMLLTLYALCLLIKSHRTTSVFVIHLILSDLIQIICIILRSQRWSVMLDATYEYSLIVGLYFMACIAFERYVLVSHPIWHKTHQTLKFTCLISVIVWFVPLTCVNYQSPPPLFPAFPQAITCFLPYPVIILCFVGTWRGLSHSISLTSQKRRMVLGTLFLVLLSYTFLILPFSVTCIFTHITNGRFQNYYLFPKFEKFVECLLYLNPLADCLLYLFMRSDVAGVMPSLRCCCRSDAQQITVRYTTRTTQSSS